MIKKNWHILRIAKIQHFSKDGEVIWEKKNLYNIVHSNGYEFILKVLLGGEPIPEGYFFGVDARTNVREDDTLSGIATEPSTFGYARQGFSPIGANIVQISGLWQAQTPAVSFTAVGGEWGPVSKLFMSTSEDASGFLISTVDIGESRMVAEGEKLTLSTEFILQNG